MDHEYNSCYIHELNLIIGIEYLASTTAQNTEKVDEYQKRYPERAREAEMFSVLSFRISTFNVWVNGDR